MILLVDTSSPICKIDLIGEGVKYHDEWSAGHNLARDFLQYLREQLSKNNIAWEDVEAIGVFIGPGSFTGLRIGLTVLNTIADMLHIPIVGAKSSNWREIAMSKIKRSENEKIILPFYGSDAKITTPRK